MFFRISLLAALLLAGFALRADSIIPASTFTELDTQGSGNTGASGDNQETFEVTSPGWFDFSGTETLGISVLQCDELDYCSSAFSGSLWGDANLVEGGSDVMSLNFAQSGSGVVGAGDEEGFLTISQTLSANVYLVDGTYTMLTFAAANESLGADPLLNVNLDMTNPSVDPTPEPHWTAVMLIGLGIAGAVVQRHARRA